MRRGEQTEADEALGLMNPQAVPDKHFHLQTAGGDEAAHQARTLTQQ